MNQRKAKRIRADMRMAIAQDPIFKDVPIASFPKFLKRATRRAKSFYGSIIRSKRHRFEVIE